MSQKRENTSEMLAGKVTPSPVLSSSRKVASCIPPVQSRPHRVLVPPTRSTADATETVPVSKKEEKEGKKSKKDKKAEEGPHPQPTSREVG